MENFSPSFIFAINSHKLLDYDEQTNQEIDRLSSIRQTCTQTNMAQVDTGNVAYKSNDDRKIKDKEEEESMTNIADNYWNISTSEFKQRLLLIVSDDDDGDYSQKIKIQQWLETDNDELFEFVRQRCSLISNFYALKMEQDFWKSYSITTQSEANWLSKLSKSTIEMNNINRIFFLTQCNMKTKLKTIGKQLERAIKNLTQHILEEQTLCTKFSNVDTRNFIFTVIIRFIRQRRQHLHTYYEKRHNELMLIADDVRCIKEFYDFKPNFLQISVARKIWKAIICKEQIQKSIDNITQEMSNDTNIHFYASLQQTQPDSMNHQLTVNEFKERYLTNQMSSLKMEFEQCIGDLENLKQSFLRIYQRQRNSNHSQPNAMLATIENRQRTLIQRIHLLNDIPNTFRHNIYEGSMSDHESNERYDELE